MRFHLSARQLKQLELGKSLDICIPHPEQELPERDDALERWITEHVEIPAGCRLSDVDRISVAVDPTSRSTGLQRVFGSLVDDPKPGDPERLTCNIDVIAFRLCRRPRARGYYPLTWPGSVTFANGYTLPEPTS